MIALKDLMLFVFRNFSDEMFFYTWPAHGLQCSLLQQFTISDMFLRKVSQSILSRGSQ